MQTTRESAFARGFWNGFCSPFLLFASGPKDSVPKFRRELSTIKLPETPQLPPLRTLEEVEGAVPGGAERVLQLIEKSYTAAFEQQRDDARESTRGQWMGFGLVVFAIVAGVVSALLGCAWQLSVSFVGLPLVGAVREFLPRGRNPR